MDTNISNLKANSTWQMDVFKDYAAVLDSMAGYSNLLGLLIGDEIVTGQYIENKGMKNPPLTVITQSECIK